MLFRYKTKVIDLDNGKVFRFAEYFDVPEVEKLGMSREAARVRALEQVNEWNRIAQLGDPLTAKRKLVWQYSLDLDQGRR